VSAERPDRGLPATGRSVTERYQVSVDPLADNDPYAFSLAFIGSGRRVLEVGCASGHMTAALVAAGNSVVGVEVDPDAAAEAANAAERVHVLDLDIESISAVEHELFDVVLAGDVLEHLRNPAAALDDVLTRLRPGGDLILSIPNVTHADVRLHLLEGRFDYAESGLLDRTHLRWFTRASLRRLLANAGMVAVDLRRVTRPLGATHIEVGPAGESAAITNFIRSDPDHDTFQFVVRAQRLTDHEGPIDNDVLASPPPRWDLQVDRDVEELHEYARNLRSALDERENSRLARVQRACHQSLATVRRRLSRNASR